MKNENQTRRLPKLLICLMLSLALVVSSSAFFLPAEAASFGGGSGTKSDPYIINTAEQLDKIGLIKTNKKYFKLGKDIDLGAYTSGKGWDPIASYSNEYEFSGTLDGNGKVIKNLVINRPKEAYVGLFAYAYKATFKNLGIIIQSGKSVLGGHLAGGLVARADNCTFINCYVKGGTVKSTDQFVDSSGNSVSPFAGGLVAWSTLDSKYTNCFADTNVVADALKKRPDGYAVYGCAGGLIGYLIGENAITGCYTAGTVKSTKSAGGLYGEDTANTTTVDSCSTSKVSSCSPYNSGLYGGGLIGYTKGNIQNCYASGSVAGKGQTEGYVGGLAGFIASSAVIKNCYASGEVTKQKEYAGGFAGDSELYKASLQSSSESTENHDQLAALNSPALSDRAYNDSSYVANANGDTYANVKAYTYVPNADDANTYANAYAAQEYDISNCYFDKTATKQSLAVFTGDLLGVSGKTTEEMRKMDTFNDWDFSSFWSIDEGKDYPRFALTKIALNKSSVSLPANMMEDLWVIFTPPGAAAGQTVEWSSNNTDIATVNSNGKVTTTKKKAGKATITAKVGTQKATCKVTVKSFYVTLRIGYSRAIQNGVKTTIDNQGTKAVVIQGRTMLPLRFVGEKMGGKVSYTNDQSPIYLFYGDKMIELKLGSYQMKVTTGSSTKKVTLDIPAQKRNGRTMIPLRAISESLGFGVYYVTELIIVSNPSLGQTEREPLLKEAKAYITK